MPSPEERKTNLPSIDDIDRIIHAPARLIILTYLEVVEEMDFIYLLNLTELTWGNLSVHLRKLEEAGYIGEGDRVDAEIPQDAVAEVHVQRIRDISALVERRLQEIGHRQVTGLRISGPANQLNILPGRKRKDLADLHIVRSRVAVGLIGARQERHAHG